MKLNQRLPLALGRPLFIPLVYCLTGGIYIILSDLVVGRYTAYTNVLWASTAKGLGFVAITAFVLWLLLSSERARGSKAKLNEQERLFREVAENLREVFWISNAERTRLEYVSPAYKEIWGRDPETLYHDPLHFLDAVHPEDRDWVTKRVRRQSEGKYDVQYRIIRPDGETRWIWDRAVPINNEPGKVCRIVGITEDITTLKEREGELLHSRKLEYLGQLSSGITHDFRNYLSVILGNAELLEEDIQQEDLRRTLQLIKQAVLDANNLTARLLAFSRKQSLKSEPVNINTLIANLVPMVKPILTGRIEIQLNLEGEVWELLLDRANFETSFINIVSNARDAMPDGGKLTIATSNHHVSESLSWQGQLLKPGDYVRIDIDDSGTGMDPDTCRQVFDPYFTTKAPEEGTGLGLSMTYGFVQQSGGCIFVNSTPEEGSIFSLYFPRYCR